MKNNIKYFILLSLLFHCFSCVAQKNLHGTYYSESDYILKITKDSTLILIVPNSGAPFEDTLAITKIKKVSNDLIELNSIENVQNNVNFSMRDKVMKDPSVRFDSIKVTFNFPNNVYEKLFIRITVLGKEKNMFKSFRFIYSDVNRSIYIPKEIYYFNIEVGPYDIGNFDFNGGCHGIKYFSPPTQFKVEGENNCIEITIPGINDAFFYRYYFMGDYARISKNSIILKGVTYTKK